MKRRACIMLFMGMIVGTVPAGSQTAPTLGPMTLAKAFTVIKPGQWVRLEGVAQSDETIMCVQAKVLPGPMREIDWAMRGVLRSVDESTREVNISGYPVRLGTDLKVKNQAGTRLMLADLKPGLLVKAEGTYTKGVFLARKVDDQAEDLKEKPGIEKKVLFQGKVERVDPVKKTLKLMGSTFTLSERTQIKSGK